MPELSQLEVQILDFERLHWRHAGSKDAAIRERFGLTPTRYYQLLSTLIERPEALAAAPAVIHRLERRLDEGRRRRSSRR